MDFSEIRIVANDLSAANELSFAVPTAINYQLPESFELNLKLSVSSPRIVSTSVLNGVNYFTVGFHSAVMSISADSSNRLTEEITALKNENKALQTTVKQTEKERNAAFKDLEKLQKKYNTLNEQHDKLMKENSEKKADPTPVASTEDASTKETKTTTKKATKATKKTK